MPLSDTAIRKATPGESPYRMTDGRGLYLIVTVTGSKLWRWKYRYAGKEKLMTFGQYPDVPLASARERHAAARKLLADGTDPMADRKAQKLASAIADRYSFKSIGAEWLAHWRVGKSLRHAACTESRLEANIYPYIGARPIAEIEAPELVTMAKRIESRGVGDLARRSLQTTGQIFRYGIAHGYCSRNPAADVKPRDILKQIETVNFARVDAEELPALLRDIEVYRGKVVTRLAMKILAHTFVRTGELIGGKWSELDWDGARWNIPAERMKKRRPHIVPLSRQALVCFRLLRTISGSGELMFPGDIDHRKPMSNNTILAALDTMGYAGRMTGHGFRGIASTVLYEHGFEEGPVELQLAHVKRNKVRGAYDHAKYLKPRAELMQWWGDYLERSLKEGLTR